nr:immunoglobulin light chain junction region [Macaca mulatta]MOX17383.1 immunoglobulin light chain junction region [Macaca mulatta]MOX19630.1 immunoglobulin light chain junction region [Macaca mulatta]MOX19692.1 immunoglobulin light chain junction region [Macaca mulatta]MOX19719.1 immunoglobulin light chain junction region [Macaca mulatta]
DYYCTLYMGSGILLF